MRGSEVFYVFGIQVEKYFLAFGGGKKFLLNFVNFKKSLIFAFCKQQIIQQKSNKMKKVLSIMAVAAVMLFAGKANAQLSIHAGYQNYSMTTELPIVGSTTGSDDGFYIGGSYNMEAGGGLAIAPGLYFAYVENAMDLRVPILMNYTLHIENLGIGAFVGPNINYGIGGDLYDDNAVNVVNRFDLGLTFGAQLSYNNISLEVGYNLGLLNRWKDAPADCSIKSNQLFVGLGYAL